MRKLVSTLRMCTTLFMARTFGRYLHSGYDGDIEYALYMWRGQIWKFPTTPYTENESIEL